MICNKCGKNNPAGAEKCSVCKEPMPPLTNCGGFSDILSYTAPPAADVAPAVPVIPVSEPVRQVVEPPIPEPWYKELLTKKNIIILSAIAACFIAIIVIVCVIVSSGGEDTEKGDTDGKDKTSQTDPQLSKKDDAKDKSDHSEKDGNSASVAEDPLPLYNFKIDNEDKINGNPIGLEFDEDGKAKFSLVVDKEEKDGKQQGNDDKIVFYCNDDLEPQTEIVLEEGEPCTIRFHATSAQFPIEIKGSKSVDGKSYHLDFKNGEIKWVEKPAKEVENPIVEGDEDDQGNGDDSDMDSDETKKVRKVGTVNVNDCDFKNGNDITTVEIWYNNNMIKKATKVTTDNPIIEFETDVPKDETEITVNVKYHDKENRPVDTPVTVDVKPKN